MNRAIVCAITLTALGAGDALAQRLDTAVAARPEISDSGSVSGMRLGMSAVMGTATAALVTGFLALGGYEGTSGGSLVARIALIEPVVIPLAIHLGNRSRGSLGRSLLASYAVAGVGVAIGALVDANSSSDPWYAVASAVVLSQNLLALRVEWTTAQRPIHRP